LVIFEGIFALLDKEINSMLDLKIFVHTDDDIRLARRLKRDIVERGRTVEGVLKSYNRFVKPAFVEFVKPTMKYADIIVPKGAKNEIAIKFIVQNLKNQLQEHGVVDLFVIKNPQAEHMDLATVEDTKEINEEFSKTSGVIKAVQHKDKLNTYDHILRKFVLQKDKNLYPIFFETMAKDLLKRFKDANENLHWDSQGVQFLNQHKWVEKVEEQTILDGSADFSRDLCLFYPDLCSSNGHLMDIIK